MLFRSRVCHPGALRKPVETRTPDGADDVDDELGSLVGLDRSRCGHGRRSRRRPRSQEMPCAEEEDEREEERAGGKPPARGREGVQHVVDVDNEPVTRGYRVCVETVSWPDVTQT